MLNDTAILLEFVTEAKEHLDAVEDDLIQIEKADEKTSHDIVDRLFRAVHSIKGGAGFLGLTAIGELTHVMEALLSMIRSGEIRPEAQFIDALLAGVDLLHTLLDDVEASNQVDISAVRDRLASLLAGLLSPEKKKELATDAQLAVKGTPLPFQVSAYTFNRIDASKYLYLLQFDLNTLEAKGKSPLGLIRELLSTGEIIEAEIRIPETDLRQGLPDGSLRYLVLYASILEEDMIPIISGLSPQDISLVDREESTVSEPVPQKVPYSAAAVSKTDSRPAETKPPSLPVPANPSVPMVTAPPEREAATIHRSSHETGGTIRIGVDILDQLMTLAGELVLVRNQHLLASDNTCPEVSAISQRLDVVTTELQQTIMRTRMQPIGNVFAKLPRMVRDLSHKLDKAIEIDIRGRDVELDKTILESLADPLTHLIRNCCDHGIEHPGERLAAGKPEHGTISVNAWHEAGQITITMNDDGAGMDAAKIRQKAHAAGLKTEAELAVMSEQEIINLILLSGFSTADTVSDVSGRGVGMDVVKTAIEELGGTLQMTSSPGEGTRFRISLPLTLAIIPCLTVRMGEDRFAIPQVNLEELVRLYDQDVKHKIECAGAHEVFRLRETLLPLVRLSEILNRPEPFSEAVQADIARSWQEKEAVPDAITFAVVKIGDRRFGLIVDEVIGTEEIVVKPMHPAVKSIGIYSGATIMGDGCVALILDIEGIARHARIPLAERVDHRQNTAVSTQPVLLFASGANEQFAVALQLVRRVEKIQADRIEHIGNKEFVTLDGITTRILRLDQHLTVSPCPAEETLYLLLPKHIDRPFGILLSDVRDIVEAPLHLDTESIAADGLLGSCMLKDRITLFVDLFRLIELAEPDWFAERRLTAPPPEQRKRVLLVEDTVFFTQLVRNYLEADGYQVVTAPHGKAALRRLREEPFDLIVSDIEMPEMDGWHFIRSVRNDPAIPAIPAIALTALDTDADRNRSLDAGFDAFEVKINREALLTRVSHTLQPEVLEVS